MGPSFQINRIVLSALVAYFLFSDFNLYLRLQTLSENTDSAEKYEKVTWVGCDISPFCHVTVKALLLDHANLYILGPLCKILDKVFSISSVQWITPNMISFFHVLVAALSALCFSSNYLLYRRVGTFLFEFRTLLDDLDGHVARVRKNIKGERTEFGSMGFYVDGVCDLLGITAAVIGIFLFLKRNPSGQGYFQLPVVVTIAPKEKDNKFVKTSMATINVVKNTLLFAILLCVSSMFWNNYIDVYQNILENPKASLQEKVHQVAVFKSFTFFCVSWLWRVVNLHSLMQYLLVAVFCDRVWEFLRMFQYVGYLMLFVAVCCTEIHIVSVRDNFLIKTVENSTSF